MNDRELLELAAKAAEIDLLRADYREHWGFEGARKDGVYIGRWNPLDNDGDALRLAVDCGIGMRFHDGWGEVFHPAVGCLPFKYEDDKRKATRYAISMVAAEIGKAMQ